MPSSAQRKRPSAHHEPTSAGQAALASVATTGEGILAVACPYFLESMPPGSPVPYTVTCNTGKLVLYGRPSRSPNTHQPKNKPINIRRGEGGGERKGGPLWSPAGWGVIVFPQDISERNRTRATIKDSAGESDWVRAIASRMPQATAGCAGSCS